MDRVIGWFRTDSSKSQEKLENMSSAVPVENKTQETKETKENQTKVNSELNKSNNAQVTQIDTSEPVLYNESNLPLNTKVFKLLQKYTYIQPEDCLLCKLTGTACATLVLISGLSVYKSFAKNRNLGIGRVRVSYTLIFAMWGTFMYKEWYNALFLPPGDLPRSFIESEKQRLERYK